MFKDFREKVDVMYRKLIAVYFSATGNTKTYIEEMAKASGLETEFYDITAAKEAPQIVCEKEDLLLLGAPDYSGRIPSLARERFANLKGKGSDAVLMVTFGNRAVDDALVEMEDLVKACGFTVVGGAGLVGRHTFGEIAEDRPSLEDKQQAADFLKAVLEKEQGSAVEMPGNRPYKDGGKGGKWRPETTSACGACGLCVENCPAHAIEEDCKTINNDLCISCFRCIRNCPTGAKQITTEAYKEFAQMLNQKLAKRQENEFYL